MWHRSLAIFMILCLATIGFSGCRKFETRRMLRKMMGSVVILPEKVLCVQNGQVFPMPEELRSRPKLIVFVDSTACSKCRIDKFAQYGSLLDLSKNTETFEVMFLLSPKKTECQDIMSHLILSMPPYPVYIDQSNRFREENPFIPDNVAMHTISVDVGNKIMLVGDPIYNDSVMELLNEIYLL